jgi:prolyl 4-hydroxylase
MLNFSYYINNEYKYIIWFISGLSIILLVYILYNFFRNVDNSTDLKSIKKHVDTLKKEYLRYPTTFGSGRDYVITKFNNLLTNKQCDMLINMAKNVGLSTSEVYENGGLGVVNEDGTYGGSTLNKDHRKSEQAWLNNNNNFNIDNKNLIKRLKLISEYITGIPSHHQEDIQVVKYEPGGYFKEHFDACEGTYEECFGMNNVQGQRITTLIIYLNDDNLEGGETKFPNINLSIKPVKGLGVLFYNVSEIDFQKIHPLSKHTGTKLIKGTKWLANVWSHKSSFNLKEPKMSDEFNKKYEKYMEIINSPDEECKCPYCPNPDCKIKKKKVLKCKNKKCINENCPNYYLKHSICLCPYCYNDYCQSKQLKDCTNPSCTNTNCPNAQKRFNDIKKIVIQKMPK